MPSWSSPGHTFLDRDAIIDEYRGLARRAMESDPRVARIILFGSVATGRATSRSDVDLLILLKEHPLPAMDRIPEYLAYFVRGSMPVDVFPMTLAELADATSGRGAFARRAMDDGINLGD
jgi:predicted nucleotidyltransferase